MGFFSLLTKPYTNAIKSISQSGEKIKKDVEDVSLAINEKKNKKNVRYVGAENSKAAFELLFKENDWTEEALKEKSTWLRKSRFIMMGFSWVAFMIGFFFLVYFFPSKTFLATSFSFFFLSSSLLCALNALRSSVYEEQIKQRDLITLKQYLKEGEFIRKFFG